MRQCRLIAIFSTPLSSAFDSEHQRVIARHQGLLLAESSRSCTAAFGQKLTFGLALFFNRQP
jgi:hypothetical protein